MKKSLHIICVVLILVAVMASLTLGSLVLIRESAYFFNSDLRFSLLMFTITFLGCVVLISVSFVWLQQHFDMFQHFRHTNNIDEYSTENLSNDAKLLCEKWSSWSVEKRIVMLSKLEDLIVYKIKHNQDKQLYVAIYGIYVDLSEYSSLETIQQFVQNLSAYVSQYRLNILLPRTE